MQQHTQLEFTNELEQLEAMKHLVVTRGLTYKVAANILGVSESTVLRKVKKYNLKPQIKQARDKALKKSKSYAESLTAFRVDARMYDPEASVVIERRYEKWTRKT